MITRLEIEGLRGFNRFELNGLGRINLLVGTNNSGKTTVLESIQMLSSPADVFTIFRILTRRGEDWVEASEVRSRSRHVDVRRLFYRHEIKKGSHFSIEAETKSGPQRFDAEIVDLPQDHQANSASLFDADVAEEREDWLSSAAIRMTWNQSGETDFLIPLNRRGGIAAENLRRSTLRIDGEERTRMISTASLSPDTIVDLFENIVLTPEEDLVIESLRIIEPTIERIATSSSERLRSGASENTKGGVLVRCTGIDRRIPIGSMGDGIWRMLGLSLALVRAEGGILLVDEIDTGLHFTVMENMWRLIYRTAKRLNVQVFATTHSRDCYESLAVICREDVSKGSDISIQRIERDRMNAIGYTEQEIVAAARRGTEVR